MCGLRQIFTVWTNMALGQKDALVGSTLRLDKSSLPWVWLKSPAHSDIQLSSLEKPVLITALCLVPFTWVYPEYTQYPVPLEPERHLVFVSPHPWKLFLIRMYIPWGQRSASVYEVSQAPGTVLAHSRPSIMFASWTDRGPSAESQAGWWPCCFLLDFLPLFSVLRHLSRLLGKLHKLSGCPDAKCYQNPVCCCNFQTVCLGRQTRPSGSTCKVCLLAYTSSWAGFQPLPACLCLIRLC